MGVVCDPGMVCVSRCHPYVAAVWSIVHDDSEEHLVLAMIGKVGVGREERLEDGIESGGLFHIAEVPRVRDY